MGAGVCACPVSLAHTQCTYITVMCWAPLESPCVAWGGGGGVFV